ncbi:MAG: hypothetical protein GY862_07950, partial [Gammaproteobacteria bacterium]|nr:hypothetical protein [Gammaproteobacteria bacterium]
MIYALQERIGEPSLFCGRKQQMELLLNWADKIPRRLAKSRALLGRRKCGKTAIMQRLFNILWNKNAKVIPFYFEVQENNQWLLDYADAYYRTFMSQYLSFKTRTVLDIDNKPWSFAELEYMAKNGSEENALKSMDTFRSYLAAERVGPSIDYAVGAPSILAGRENVFFLVMIDEIQLMSKYIFYDREHKVSGETLPGIYHGQVESKVVPMLVSGSYVGWMTQMIQDYFKGGRLKKTSVSSKLAAEEGMEAVYRYAEYYGEEVSEEGALVINLLTQSDPFYISTLLKSDWPEKDFRSKEGVVKTLAYEILDREGELFGTWSEYIYSTLREVNDRYAKQILLFLSKERHKEWTRTEISDHLGGKLSDGELETKLRTLEYGDLITRPGLGSFRYCGIPDDILDLIFRDLYQEEIDQVKPDIAKKLSARVAALEKEKKSMAGAFNELKGRVLELIVCRELNKCQKERNILKNLKNRLRPTAAGVSRQEKTEKNLAACCTSLFDMTWMNYYLQLPKTGAVELDVLAEGEDADTCWALVFEVKNRNE